MSTPAGKSRRVAIVQSNYIPWKGYFDMIRQVDHAMLELGRYQRGDLVIIVAGAPPDTVGSTNLIHVHRIGENDH